MSNRFLTKDELPAAFAEQARVWREQWRAWRAMENAPSVQVPDTLTPAEWDKAIANAPRHLQIVPKCDHCWHRLCRRRCAAGAASRERSSMAPICPRETGRRWLTPPPCAPSAPATARP